MPYYKEERKRWKRTMDLSLLWQYNAKDVIATWLIAFEQMKDLEEVYGWRMELGDLLARSKLTYQQVQEIRRECAEEGSVLKRLLDDIKFHRRTISDIKNRNFTVGSQIKVILQMNYATNFLDSQIQVWRHGDSSCCC